MRQIFLSLVASVLAFDRCGGGRRRLVRCNPLLQRDKYRPATCR